MADRPHRRGHLDVAHQVALQDLDLAFVHPMRPAAGAQLRAPRDRLAESPDDDIATRGTSSIDRVHPAASQTWRSVPARWWASWHDEPPAWHAATSTGHVSRLPHASHDGTTPRTTTPQAAQSVARSPRGAVAVIAVSWPVEAFSGRLLHVVSGIRGAEGATAPRIRNPLLAPAHQAPHGVDTNPRGHPSCRAERRRPIRVTHWNPSAPSTLRYLRRAARRPGSRRTGVAHDHPSTTSR